MSDTVVLDGALSLTNLLDGEAGTVIEVGHGTGIDTIVFNSDYTLTFNMTNGETFTTGSIRGEQGQHGEPGDDYVLTEQDKEDIADLVPAPEGMVVNATLMSDPWYSVDKTYAEIGLAVADGINVVMLSDGKVFPYAGMMYFQSVPVITFGSFFAYDGKLVSNGFIVTMDDNDATIAQKIQSETTIPALNDVQINGTSIVENGVANVPKASNSALGVVGINSVLGISINGSGQLFLSTSSDPIIKAGANQYYAISPYRQHLATFYGLAKSAGHDEKNSTLPVGQYTEEAKSAISDMLNGSVSVSGTTPTIVAKSGIRYVCGEVATLDFTPSASGICDVVFTSGSTATVLTVPSTIKWANGFDPTALEANTTYELNVMDGLGVAVGWT